MSSGFVSEKVLEEKRQERQKEWEKVRKPEDPQTRPEENDANSVHRSLFDQLESNRNKAQEEWDEKHQLKNQIRGIDDDEAEFLDQVHLQKYMAMFWCTGETQRRAFFFTSTFFWSRGKISFWKRDKKKPRHFYLDFPCRGLPGH